MENISSPVAVTFRIVFVYSTELPKAAVLIHLYILRLEGVGEKEREGEGCMQAALCSY